MKVSIQVRDGSLDIEVSDEVDSIDLSGDGGVLATEYLSGNPEQLIDSVVARAKAAYFKETSSA